MDDTTPEWHDTPPPTITIDGDHLVIRAEQYSAGHYYLLGLDRQPDGTIEINTNGGEFGWTLTPDERATLAAFLITDDIRGIELAASPAGGSAYAWTGVRTDEYPHGWEYAGDVGDAIDNWIAAAPARAQR